MELFLKCFYTRILIHHMHDCDVNSFLMVYAVHSDNRCFLNEENDQKSSCTYTNAWLLRWKNRCNEMFMKIQIDATNVNICVRHNANMHGIRFKTERTNSMILVGVTTFSYDNVKKIYPWSNLCVTLEVNMLVTDQLYKFLICFQNNNIHKNGLSKLPMAMQCPWSRRNVSEALSKR